MQKRRTMNYERRKRIETTEKLTQDGWVIDIYGNGSVLFSKKIPGGSGWHQVIFTVKENGSWDMTSMKTSAKFEAATLSSEILANMAEFVMWHKTDILKGAA